MNILFVTSECYPLIKTGGLADVSGALPKALANLKRLSGDVKLLLPGYPSVLEKAELKPIAQLSVLNQSCQLLSGVLEDASNNQPVELLVIQSALYEREGGPYNDLNGQDWPDNPLRFALLSRVASLLCLDDSPYPNWQPDLVHCNDWQTGLAPIYMKHVDQVNAKSVFSIHNLAFQGCFDAGWMHELQLPVDHYQMEGFEYYGQLSFLKAGLYYADQLTTVSPTYAQEIQTDEFGFGMQGLLSSRQSDLVGILNGIDSLVWNPASDPFLFKHYEAARIAGKKTVKRLLKQSLGLHTDKHSPLLGIVSRFAHQKGLDLLPAIIPRLVEQGCQFVILGSGDRTIESAFLSLAEKYAGDVSVTVDYDEALSHNIMAGADIFVMPSRFEPCGLNQMYGMAYGTPPVVSARGGLADSVMDTNNVTLQEKTATGFVIDDVDAASLMDGVMRAIAFWKKPKIWREIQRHGMQSDFTWQSRAEAYLLLYNNMFSDDE